MEKIKESVEEQISKQNDDSNIIEATSLPKWARYVIMSKWHNINGFLKFGDRVWFGDEEQAKKVLESFMPPNDDISDFFRLSIIKVYENETIDPNKPDEFAKAHNF